MATPFNENLDRYRLKAAQQIGGSPHAVRTYEQQGWHPSAGEHLPYFFDKAWILDRENPDAKVEGLSFGRVVHATGSSPAPSQTQLLLRLATPCPTPASLEIPLTVSESSFGITNWRPDFDANTWMWQFNNHLYAQMVKEPLTAVGGYSWNMVNYWNGGLSMDDLNDICGGLTIMSYPYNGIDTGQPTFTIQDFKVGPIQGRYFPSGTPQYYGVLLAWSGNLDTPGVWNNISGKDDVEIHFAAAVTNILDVAAGQPRAFMLDQWFKVNNP